MDKLAELSHGAKVVLGAAIAFLVFSFFNWFKYTGPGADQIEAVGGDIGISMWHGIGWIAGLLAIAIIVWQAIRLANINFEIGVTPSMITAALAVLLVIFAFIRFIDKPSGGDLVGRTFWAWLCLALAIVVVVGAWMNMQAAGESLGDVRDRVSSMTAGGGSDATAPAGAAPGAASEGAGAAADAADAAADAPTDAADDIVGGEPPRPA
jgi:hypothetical protein